MVGPISGRRLVPLSRPVYRDDGSLIGIAVTTLDVASFVAPFQNMKSPHSSTVTVIERNPAAI